MHILLTNEVITNIHNERRWANSHALIELRYQQTFSCNGCACIFRDRLLGLIFMQEALFERSYSLFFEKELESLQGDIPLVIPLVIRR